MKIDDGYRLASVVGEYRLTVKAKSTETGLLYTIAGGSPWGRRLAASIIRNAIPGARARGVDGRSRTAWVVVSTRRAQ